MRDPQRHPWIVGGLVLRASLVRKILDEAEAGYVRDEESCGLLTGPEADPWLVDAILPMENRANRLHALDPAVYPRTGRMYFDIDPLKFARAVEQGEANGRPAKVLYHSHLDVGAYFSETDAQAATHGGSEPLYDLAYLVTSVVAGKAGEQGLFVWDPGTRSFVSAPFTVLP